MIPYPDHVCFRGSGDHKVCIGHTVCTWLPAYTGNGFGSILTTEEEEEFVLDDGTADASAEVK
jgi:hypothetical protein